MLNGRALSTFPVNFNTIWSTFTLTEVWFSTAFSDHFQIYLSLTKWRSFWKRNLYTQTHTTEHRTFFTLSFPFCQQKKPKIILFAYVTSSIWRTQSILLCAQIRCWHTLLLYISFELDFCWPYTSFHCWEKKFIIFGIISCDFGVWLSGVYVQLYSSQWQISDWTLLACKNLSKDLNITDKRQLSETNITKLDGKLFQFFSLCFPTQHSAIQHVCRYV